MNLGDAFVPNRPNPQFHKTLEVMADTHDAKSKDYATAENRYSNFEFAAVVAGCSVDTVFRVLLGIKLARLKVLLESGKAPAHESVQDSRLDLATYAALWASYEAAQSDGPQLT